MSANEHFEMIANEFFLDTGYLAPGKSEAPQAYYDGRDHERQGAWNAWNRMRKNIAPPCPQCARFREKAAQVAEQWMDTDSDLIRRVAAAIREME